MSVSEKSILKHISNTIYITYLSPVSKNAVEIKGRGEIQKFRNPGSFSFVSSAQLLPSSVHFLSWGPTDPAQTCPLAMSSTKAPDRIMAPSGSLCPKWVQPGARARGTEKKAPPNAPQVWHPLLLTSLPHTCLYPALQSLARTLQIILIQMSCPLHRRCSFGRQKPT